MPRDIDERIETEVDRLRSMRIAELRVLWRAKFKADPPKAFGPDLLRRSLAQKIQGDAYGGLHRRTAKLLDQLIAQSTKGMGKIVMPRRIKPGAVLVREWKGESHRVMVLEDGFVYEGKSYSSLSEIARLITGTRWNGPRFFGMRASRDEEEPANKGREAEPSTPASSPGRRMVMPARRAKERGI